MCPTEDGADIYYYIEAIVETKIESTYCYRGITSCQLVYCDRYFESPAQESCHLFNTERELGARRPATGHNRSSNLGQIPNNFLSRGREPERFNQKGEDNF